MEVFKNQVSATTLNRAPTLQSEAVIIGDVHNDSTLSCVAAASDAEDSSLNTSTHGETKHRSGIGYKLCIFDA